MKFNIIDKCSICVGLLGDFGQFCRCLTSPMKISKLQHNSLVFVAGLKRATDEGLLPEIAQYSPYYLPLNVLLFPKD